MTITVSPRAEKQLRKLPKFDQLAIVQKIRTLFQVIVSGEEKLSGFPSIYRARVGNYRIVYRKLNTPFYIILIGHRRDIYRVIMSLLRQPLIFF